MHSLLILFSAVTNPSEWQQGKRYWEFHADRNNTAATHRLWTQRTDSLLSRSNFQFRSDIQRPVSCPITNNTGTTLSPYSSAGCLDTLRNVLQFLKTRPFATRHLQPKFIQRTKVRPTFTRSVSLEICRLRKKKKSGTNNSC